MPKVLDNIEHKLLTSLREMLQVSHRGDFCVGYFHLRGWRKVADLVEQFEGGPGKQARILVGMTQTPEDALIQDLSLFSPAPLDNRTAKRRETALVEGFRRQITFGLPDSVSEAGLRQLARQLRSGKARVKLFLRYPLHAKLYLTYSCHPGAPTVGFVGSSNLTGPGLSDQGELNVDVTEQDAASKLSRWFEERWSDPLSRDISILLAEIIEESWAREEPVSPYLVYLKMAYHLAFEALEGPKEYRLPSTLEALVLPFQREAIFRLRRMLHSDPTHPQLHSIAVIGDVVGMGKTLTATAVAKLYQDDHGGRVIVCCPSKLKSMWDGYLQEHEIAGEVVPYSQHHRLSELKGRCRLVVLDESHNLRNRETLVWSTLRDFIRDQDAKVLLLSATPYNKQYQDLGNQLRLGLDEHADLGVRPEAYFRTHSEELFAARYQASPRSLIAFEQSVEPDDWRDLLRHFMVRRTRAWIMRHYSDFDPERNRYYLTLSGGVRSYFPRRVPKTLGYAVDPGDPEDQYASLFNSTVVDTISALRLPRYGLGAYRNGESSSVPTPTERLLLDNLALAGERLIGYCRTNLFKRLESSGHSFLLSLRRHIIRNLVHVHALENGLDLPIGTQDAQLLDSATSDADPESQVQVLALEPDSDGKQDLVGASDTVATSLEDLRTSAVVVYNAYVKQRQAGRRNFRWIGSSHFNAADLVADLLADSERLQSVLRLAGEWRPETDSKLTSLKTLLTTREGLSKVVVFTQFADTAQYLAAELRRAGIEEVAEVTAATARPVDIVRRFSPVSNNHVLKLGESAIRVLIATEVLSEGQNCQDGNVVVNYDLPWAIIRLIQRAGRVDRLGQDNAEVRIYSCLPAEGVENLISLRRRLIGRLKQNHEVIGTDERFFEDEDAIADELSDIFTEKDHIFSEDDETEDVDLPTLAAGIWHEAIRTDPTLEAQVKNLPPMIHASRWDQLAGGVLVYFKTTDGYDSLLKVNETGQVSTQSQLAVLRLAACAPDTPSAPPAIRHHDLVRNGITQVLASHDKRDVLAALGPRTGARRRLYDRMAGRRADLRAQGGLFAHADVRELDALIEGIVRHPLTERAREILNRRFREGVVDAELVELALGLLADDRLFQELAREAGDVPQQPRLICSIGIRGS